MGANVQSKFSATFSVKAYPKTKKGKSARGFRVLALVDQCTLTKDGSTNPKKTENPEENDGWKPISDRT
jgi:hypothetical protein